MRWYYLLNMTVNPINVFLVSFCLFTFGPSSNGRINDLNDDACHNVQRVNHSFLNKQKKVINEHIITKQLQYKVSISAELADWWCDGWFNDLVKFYCIQKWVIRSFLGSCQYIWKKRDHNLVTVLIYKGVGWSEDVNRSVIAIYNVICLQSLNVQMLIWCYRWCCLWLSSTRTKEHQQV